MKKTAKKLIRLPRVFRTKWLNALESGRYKQTKSILCGEEGTNLHSFIKRTKGYCCLGVAGKVLKINDDMLEGKSMPVDLDEKNVQKYPKAFIRVSSKDSLPSNSDFAFKLADMNDEGSTFKQIAAYIRSNTRGV